MGLILGIFVAACTILWCVVIGVTNSMPSFIIGTLIAGALIFTHYVHIGW